jgi:hypothetical protein
MTCRVCGATIADKAIVCYRCGAPTADAAAPVQGPSRDVTRRRSPTGGLVLLVMGLLALVGGWLLQPGDDMTGELLLAAGVGLVLVSGARLFGGRRETP